jgi:hypothetical protein
MGPEESQMNLEGLDKLVESPESNRSDLNIERYKAESYTRNS